MRHYKKGRKLGTDTSHTKAMKKSLVCALLANDRIKTIDSRAKEIRPDVDKIITWAKRGDLHSRRLAIAALGDKELVREVFEKVAQGMFQDRQGGYTRIMKLGPRKGDDAPMVIMELVTEPVKAKKDEAKPAAKKAAKKAAPKKVEKADDEAMAVRRLGFYARCGAVDTGWTEHLFDAWFRVLVLPAEGETLDAETANKELADCYSRVMGADKWRRYVRLYRPDGTEEKF